MAEGNPLVTLALTRPPAEVYDVRSLRVVRGG